VNAGEATRRLRAGDAPTAALLRRHVLEDLLPLWARHGLDARGVFVNRLDARRRPLPDGFTRALVQARQLYAFSRGHELGGGDELARAADSALHALREVFHDRRHGGFFTTATPAGEPLDPRKDLYVHAFAVFALAHRGRIFGDRESLALAVDTASQVETRLADPREGGYFEAADRDWAPRHGARRHNPHMHWLEAWLALHAATGDAGFLERAGRLVELLETRLLDPRGPRLPEHFDARWRPLPDTTVEPGHHYEWCWLLHRFAEATGRPTPDAAAGLFAFAERHGVDEDDLVFDALDGSGAPRDRAKRLWPQTERAKALAVRGDAAALTRVLGRICRAYLRSPDGGWTEHLTRDGRPRGDTQNATSVYHVVLALNEAGEGL